MLEQLSDKLEAAFKKIRGQGKITEENITESMREIRVALLSADVNYKTAKQFIARLKERALGEKVIHSITPGQLLVKITQDELTTLLGEHSAEPAYQGASPLPVLVMGLQGSGKTTFCGKLALRLRSHFKKNPLLAACDIYRPAAVKQLETIGKSLGIPVFQEEQSDPVTIAKHAQTYADKHEHDIVIYDTAGRLQIDDDMMAELERMVKLLSPREKFLVADAMTGQDAVNIAGEFNSRFDISGVVLSKLDGDTRGGAALSIKSVTGKPIIYMGIGEKPDALEVLHPDRLASRILGMGDVVSLVEKAQDAFDRKEARIMEKKILRNKFDLNDFLVQIQQIKKMGSISDLMGMIPGFSKLKDMNVDEKQLVHVEAILSSATNHERTMPKILDGSRRRRIAAGSGTSIQQVNQVLKQFEQMRKMIKQFMGGGNKGKQMRRMMKQMGSGGLPGI